jgi:hypothetical protein
MQARRSRNVFVLLKGGENVVSGIRVYESTLAGYGACSQPACRLADSVFAGFAIVVVNVFENSCRL